MKEADVGDVVVAEDGQLIGILTDRDIVVRVLAEHLDPKKTKVADIASTDVRTLRPEDGVEKAVELMRENAVRRIPVVDNEGQLKAIVSIGDLAMREDPKSVLADISKAPANG
jgi:CBS domain-containing protein